MKKPRLFYWEDAVDCWTPVYEGMLEVILDEQIEKDGEIFQLALKRSDMTDEEYDNLPEV